MEKILIITKNPDYTSIITSALGASYSLVFADSYDDICSHLKDRDFSLIMPIFDSNADDITIDGTLFDMRCTEFIGDIPIICIIPRSSDRLLDACLSLGVYDIIAMPVPPAIIDLRVCRAIEAETRRRQVCSRIDVDLKKAEMMALQSLVNIAKTIDAKNPLSSSHSTNTAAYAVEIAKALEWDEIRIMELYYSAMLHDIGKIAISDKELLKEGPLDENTRKLLRSHVESGFKLLNSVSPSIPIADHIRSHHEYMNGGGYPDGLSGDRIPPESRIIAVAGAYDAMVSPHVYRPAMTHEAAAAELRNNSGTQFDPLIVDTFLDILDSGFHPCDSQDIPCSDMFFKDRTGQLLKYVLNERSNKWKHEAEQDYLTGLLNRRSGEEHISRLLERENGALMMIDIDNFKEINDTYGHLTGDMALKEASTIFLSCARDDDIVCRIGGDEYLLYLRHATTPELAGMIAERIIDAYSEKASHDPVMQCTSLSIGIVLASVGTHDFNELFNRADKALYYVKQNGKSGFSIYDSKEKPTPRAEPGSNADMKQLLQIIKNRSIENGVFRTDFRQFNRIYEFASHFAMRHEQKMMIIMLTLHSSEDMNSNLDGIEAAMQQLESAIKTSLRSVDISTRYSSSQYVVVLMGSDKTGAKIATSRICRNFYDNVKEGGLILNYIIQSLEGTS